MHCIRLKPTGDLHIWFLPPDLCIISGKLFCLCAIIITKHPRGGIELTYQLSALCMLPLSVDQAGSPWRSIALLSFRDCDSVAHPWCPCWIYYKVINRAFALHWLSMSSVQSSVLRSVILCPPNTTEFQWIRIAKVLHCWSQSWGGCQRIQLLRNGMTGSRGFEIPRRGSTGWFWRWVNHHPAADMQGYTPEDWAEVLFRLLMGNPGFLRLRVGISTACFLNRLSCGGGELLL